MAHQYKENDVVWYKGEKWTVQAVSKDFAHIVQYPNNPIGRQVRLSDLSPYPPVKEEEGFALVDGSRIAWVYAGTEEGCKNSYKDWYLDPIPKHYRCIPVKIVPR